MRYDNLRAFIKHLEGANPHHFSPLYFVLGKETFECQEAIHLLLQFLLPSQEMRKFALTQLDGSQLEEQELGCVLSSASFFSKTHVVWIRHAEKLKKSTQEALIKYFARPLSSQYLLLSAVSWQKNTTFYKAAEKEGIILEFSELKPWEKEQYLTEWVNKRVIAARKLISFPTCQFLVKQIGYDQALLAQEIEKLLCFIGDKQEILQQDIESLCHRQPVDNVWQLGEALFRRDPGVAIQIIHDLLTDGQPLLALLRQIRGQFQTGYQICLLLAQGKGAHEVSNEFPYLKGQILERHMRQAQHYGLKAFKKGLLALDATELRAKNSSIDDKLLAELLTMQLTMN